MKRPDRLSRFPARTLLFLLCVLLCAATVLASGSDCYASDESGAETPGNAELLIRIDREEITVPPAPEPETPLTPEGNLTLTDDLVQKMDPSEPAPVREFLTVHTRNGNDFYLIVDRAGGEENVHFLNQVDLSDLLRILDEEPEEEEASCICQLRCQAGEVNTDCPVCRLHMTQCLGTVRIREESTAAAAPVREETPRQAEEPDAGRSRGKIAAAAAALLALGGAAVILFLRRRGKGSVRGGVALGPFSKQIADEFEMEPEDSTSPPGQEGYESDEADGQLHSAPDPWDR